MARRVGQLEFDYSIELLKTIPLDARQLVRTKEELLDPASFTYGYKGMIVACRDEEKLYMLIDNTNPTAEASWKEIGGSIAGYDDTEVRALIAALQSGKANVADLSAVATSGSYNDLADRPVLPAPYDDSALSERVNALEDAGFLTEHQDISGKANVADLAAVATSGSYNDLSDKPTIPPAVTVDAAMSDTSENPVQNKVVLAAIGDAIDVVETAIADRYTKAETDGKIAEAMVDVDNEHFHPVTALPDPSVAKENHEYVLITYAQDGTTIESETHYLFYDGMFHEKQTQVSLDGYATEAYVDTATGALDTRVTTVETNVAGKAYLVGDSAGVTIRDNTSNNNITFGDYSQNGKISYRISGEEFGDNDDPVYLVTDTYVDAATGALDTRVTAVETSVAGKAYLVGESDGVTLGDNSNNRITFGDVLSSGKVAYCISGESFGDCDPGSPAYLVTDTYVDAATGALNTRVTAIETALNLTALTDEEIAALVPA